MPGFNIVLFIISLFMIGVSNHTYAAAIGQFEPTLRFGVGTKINRVSVNDDIGSSTTIMSNQSLSAYFTDWFVKDTRYLSEVYVANYAFKADVKHPGQVLSQQGLRFSVQTNPMTWRNFSPWIGGGLALANTSYRKRHTVDEDGYLLEEFENASKPGLSILVNIMEKLELTPNFQVAAKLEYNYPLVQSTEELSFGFILFYRPDKL